MEVDKRNGFVVPAGMLYQKNTYSAALVLRQWTMSINQPNNAYLHDALSFAEYSGLPVYVKGPQCREEELTLMQVSGIWATKLRWSTMMVDLLL